MMKGAFGNPPYPTVYSNLSYDVPLPKMGDTDALADIIERTEKMFGAMVSMVSKYFEQRQAGPT